MVKNAGYAKEAVLETMLAGPLGCGLFTMKADMFKSEEYPVQFPFKHMNKDLNFILETAEEAGLSVEIGKTLKTLYGKGMDKGLAELDFAAIKQVIES